MDMDVRYQWTCMDRVHTNKLYEYWTWLCWPATGDHAETGWGVTKAEAKRRLEEMLRTTSPVQCNGPAISKCTRRRITGSVGSMRDAT